MTSTSDIFKNNVEKCANFFGNQKDDPLDDIRKNFYYHMHFVGKYFHLIRAQYKNDRNNYNMYKEIMNLAKYWKLIADNYLAIILYKSENINYEPLIRGISGYYNCLNMGYIPSLMDQIKNNSKEYILEDSEEYFLDLFDWNNGGGFGLFEYTTSLMSIMILEKEILKPNESIKVLRYENIPQYGDLKL